MTLIKKGLKGAKILDIQQRLRLLNYSLGPGEIDGIFGPETENAVKKFQQDRAISVTGIIDDECWQELVDAGYSIGDRMLYLKEPPFRGDDVKTLQLWLKTLGFFKYNENGIFNKNTHKALIEFQKNMKLNPDGILGGDTFTHLNSLKRIINEKQSSNFPFIRDLKNKKQNKEKIVLDYGEFPSDSQENSKFYLSEKIKICKNIVDKCRDSLEKEGFNVFITLDYSKKYFPKLFSRIKKANKSKGDLLVSINLNYCNDSEASGSSCYYFKGLKSFSIGGRRIAELIQDKLIKNLNMTDCRIHGTSYAILKSTNMTSVLVEPGFISNYYEALKLKDPKYQNDISNCISEAIKQYLNE
ncbi:peptidoglycan-binding protein [bacterium]|nr:peptidoglycan-binding protein [bacterium]